MPVNQDPPDRTNVHRSTRASDAEPTAVQLARVLAQFPGAVAVYAGPQHVFRAASAAYRAFIGGREVIGLPIREALPELDGQGFFELLDQAYQTGESVSVSGVTAQWDSDGDGSPESRVIDFTYQPLTAADGSVEGVVAFVQDVTERHMALAALAASEARHRLAIDATRLGTWAWDVGSDTATFDDRVRELLGLPDKTGSSRVGAIVARVHPDDRDRLNEAFARVVDPEGDGRFQGEYRIVRDDGRERWVLAFGRMHFVEDTSPRQAAQLIGTLVDITDQKHAEARQRVLARLGADLLVAGDEQIALQRLADAAVADLADWAIVDVIGPDGRAYRAAIAHADPAKLDVMRELSARYPPDPSHPTMGRDALATGQAQLYAVVDDALVGAMAQDAEQARLAKAMGLRSAMAVPLQTRFGPFGIAAFGSGRRTFTPDDVAVAEEIGRRASLAVENARLIAEARRAQTDAERAVRRTARLQMLSAALAAALTPNDVATVAVNEGVAAAGADAGMLVLLDPQGTALDVVEARGYDTRHFDRWRHIPLDVTVPVTEAVRTGELIVVASAEERKRRYPTIDAAGVPVMYPATISVPLIAEGRSFGALGLSFRDTISVGPDDRELLLAVGRQCAQAVRRATLFDAEAVARADAEAANRRLAFLADASAALASLDYETTLQRVAQLTVPSFADYVVIDLLDENGGIRRVASAHADPSKAEMLRDTARFYPAAGADSPLREPLVSGKASLVGQVDDAWLRRAGRTPEHLAAIRALNPQSLIVAPLSARDHTLGIMTFVASDSGRRYGAGDVPLAVEVARRAAVAVDNAELYRHSEAARREAEAASRAKGQFLAVMSHELRTPLNAILGYSELVGMGVHGPVTDAQRDAMSRIKRSGQHLLSLVNNVLNLERTEAGGIETEFVPISVRELFEDADSLTRPQAEAKGITLAVELPGADVVALGEQDKASQVLVNLLSNAVKFTVSGGTIRLSCDVDADSVHLRVADTGVGIPGEAIDRVFEPFVQLDSGLTRRAEGAGLGLAISRRLARLMGGDLTLESELGKGSTFTFTLVRVPPSSAAD